MFDNLQDNELLITGVTGKTVNFFLHELEKNNFNKKVKCLVRKSSNISKLNSFNLDLEFIHVDFNDVDSLRKGMDGSKVVLHTAGIFLSKNVFKAGKQVNIDWYICVHSSNVFSNSELGNKYREIEGFITSHFHNVTFLRPTMIYGVKTDNNMWKLVSFLYKYKFFPVFGAGKNLIQPVHAKSLGQAYYDVIKNHEITFGKEYTLSGQSSLTYREALYKITNIMNKKVYFLSFPMWLSHSLIYFFNLITFNHFPIKVDQIKRFSEDKAFCWKKAKDDFGYNPISFDEGIEGEINDFLKTIPS